ncbi:MAG: dihydroorotate dehydrogenase [Dehalococcoidia bacterium]|nr:dihydroorotate dehydrogenase [Dehalococcoidia bacterium]
MNLSVQLAPRHPKGLRLTNPVMTASGTFGYGTEYAQLMDIQKLGAIVCKGTTLKSRTGNLQPRIVETTAGMLNSIGLQNIGVEALVAEKAPIWATWRVPVIVNIAGDTVQDYAALAGRLEGIPGVSGIEVNVSCPNTAAGGALFGKDPKVVAEVTRAVKRASSLPIIVKLTPNVTDICEVAIAAAEAGADALSLINTLAGMAIDARKRKPVLGNINGGLSGPAIKPVALHMVYRVAKVVKVPIIGIGGITSGLDAIEFIEAGASAVQVGMANFVNPRCALDVLEGIEEFLKEEGIEDVSQLVGAAL